MAHDHDNHPHDQPHGAETAPMHDPVDHWHDHSKDQMPQQAHAEVGNARAIIGIGVGLFFVIVFAVVAVYAYYVWFISRRLSEQEIASGKASPAIQAVEYKRDALIRLEKGGSFTAPKGRVNAAESYTLRPLDEALERIAREYAAGK